MEGERGTPAQKWQRILPQRESESASPLWYCCSLYFLRRIRWAGPLQKEREMGNTYQG